MPEPDVRSRYEAAVNALARSASAMRAAGTGEEQVARWVVAERNRLKEAYRDLTPPDLLARIEARTMQAYGNVLGPSVDQLRAAGKSWTEIIDSAARAGVHPFGPAGFPLPEPTGD
ncbi:hemagglutinin [Variovorax sp. IB41]|uniref:hemagglutinin n=1 Tax=Variovorax sp. IB41 TaxID=2779370 RepID=UPI0018E7B820|nr:hemagglutinin [Variovorax sp. IB41]MBJ2160128.1 hemagglutinin [Variovorax sp. IB41]